MALVTGMRAKPKQAKCCYSSDTDAFLTGVMEGAAVAIIVVLPIGLLVLWLGGWLP